MKKAFLFFLAIFVSTIAMAQVKCSKNCNKSATETKELGAMKSGYSKEELEFLSDPTLRIVDDKEFERYKKALDNYFQEVNRFLNDAENLTRFPSHSSYLQEYRRLYRKVLDRIENDNWFKPLYNSRMNPVSSYTRNYKDELEQKATENSNTLP